MIFLQNILSLIVALLTAIVAGLVGSFALMKRMTLAGDVISHVALPGLGLALLYGTNPIIGGAATLAIGIVLIWHLEKRADLATETAIGVIFAASLAIGALVTPSEELIEALFGGFGNLSFEAFVASVVIACAVGIGILRARHKLVLSLFSPDLARATGVNVERLNLLYLFAFGATVLLGLRFLGALLVGALIIIPAAIGRQLTHTLNRFLLISSLASVASALLGIFVSFRFELELGPTVVAVASGLFILALIKKKN